MNTTHRPFTLFTAPLVAQALLHAVAKLSPMQQWRRPVMFVVYLGSLLTTLMAGQALTGQRQEAADFIITISLWLWFTVLFANVAEALAEGRSQAQADYLRSSKRNVTAKRLMKPHYGAPTRLMSAAKLRKGDVVLIEVGDWVPGDGEVIEGIASVDESAITGESAAVIRESGGDCSAVTGGSRLLSDWLVVRITHQPGETFLDKMIAMVESAHRQKTPNEIALTIVLVTLTLLFLLVTVSLLPLSRYSVQSAATGQPITLTVLVALLVCLIPTTIGGLLSAIGVAGIGRMLQNNVIATSGRAVEAAGDIDVLLLDKTGTITLGNRQATALFAVNGISEQALAQAAFYCSLADETAEGRSIVALIMQRYRLDDSSAASATSAFIPFTAKTRMSGVDMAGRQLRKGAADAIARHIVSQGGVLPTDMLALVESIARRGSTPLLVADNATVLGVIELKDIVKSGIKQRFGELRQMGIKTIMVTGDNRLTAAAIAAEAGVDDFLAEVTPEAKLQLILQHQAEGRLVAMTGDGTNDAPALAQADVAVAMNSGTPAAKEACNMVDLDSNPTKLIEIVETGKQLLMTRGALTTFSIANDVAKYFAIIPAAFSTTYPELGQLNVMGLASPNSAILSAVIFNALIIIALIPLALRGVPYRALGAERLLQRHLLLYGVGGLVAPFVGIKAIDWLLGLKHVG